MLHDDPFADPPGAHAPRVIPPPPSPPLRACVAHAVYDPLCDACEEVNRPPEPPDFPPDYRCFDVEAQADLALHDELWPDGYGR